MQLSEFQKNKRLSKEYRDFQKTSLWGTIIAVLNEEHPTRQPLVSSNHEDAASRAWRSEGYEMALRVLKGLGEVKEKEYSQLTSNYGAKSNVRRTR